MALSVEPLILEPRPIVPLPGHWTFWADTMPYQSRQPIPLGPVDVSGFGYTTKLSGFGHGTATVALPCGIEPARLLSLWSWRLWCFYDGQLVWCGVPTGIQDEDAAARVTITLTELTGYATKQVLDIWPFIRFGNQDPDNYEPPVEQTAIAYDLVRFIEQIGITIIREPGPGFPRFRTYQYLEGDNRGALLVNLSQVNDGPEFRSEYRMGNDGQPQCLMRIAYPRVGSSEAGLGVTIPGGALSYRAQWDADMLRTWTWAVGDLPESAEPDAVKPTVLEQRPSADLPRIDHVDDWPGTFLESTLRERANTMADRHILPVLNLTAAPPASYPPLGQYGVGDDVTVNVTNPLLPGGLIVTGRLTELSVSAGGGTATWTVVTSLPPPQPRETITGRMDRTDTALSQQFHSGPMRAGWVAPGAEPPTGAARPPDDSG